jgi:uncharacterized protein
VPPPPLVDPPAPLLTGSPLPPLRAVYGSPPAGWFPDPWSAEHLRWWDGAAWSAATARWQDAPRPPMPSLPLGAALGAIVVTAAALIGSRVVLDSLGDLRWPVVVYVALSVGLAYGPMLAFCFWASRRWGSGNLAEDTGLRVRWVDAGWGPVVWLAAIAAEVAVATIVTRTSIPIESNTEGIDNLGGERGVIVALLITAVIAAPFVEELVYRGIVLRGLSSHLPIWFAVGAQGVLFGSAHVDPSRGAGNIGLVLVLSAVGAVLGGAAVLLRRIGPTILAHMILNGVVMLIVLFVR